MYYESNELMHYGVLGMRWGRRKYTNPDGSLNALGKKRKAMMDAKDEKKAADKAYSKAYNKGTNKEIVETAEVSARADAKYRIAKREFTALKKQTMVELKGSSKTSAGKAAATVILGGLAGATVAAGAIYAVGAKFASDSFDFAKDLID